MIMDKRFRWTIVAIGSLLGGGVAISLALGLWASAATFAILLGCNLAWWFMIRRSFFHGWLMGRLAMWESMPQAMARGMSPMEWINAEMERDGFHAEVVLEGDDEDSV